MGFGVSVERERMGYGSESVGSGAGASVCITVSERGVGSGVALPLYMAGLAFHPNGMKLRGKRGPMGRRGTTLPFANKNCVKSVPG